MSSVQEGTFQSDRLSGSSLLSPSSSSSVFEVVSLVVSGSSGVSAASPSFRRPRPRPRPPPFPAPPPRERYVVCGRGVDGLPRPRVPARGCTPVRPTLPALPSTRPPPSVGGKRPAFAVLLPDPAAGRVPCTVCASALA